MSSQLPEAQTEQVEQPKQKPSTKWQAYRKHFTRTLVVSMVATFFISAGAGAVLAISLNAKHTPGTGLPVAVLTLMATLHQAICSYITTPARTARDNPPVNIEYAGGWLGLTAGLLVTLMLTN